MASPTIRIVSWDLDGTLYPMGPMVRALWLLAAREGWRPATWRALWALARFRRAMAAVRRRGGVLGDGALAGRAEILAHEEHWYGRAIARVGVRAGVAEVIRGFRDAGLRQIVVSDYRVEYKLRALGLDSAFDRVYAGEELGHLKPSGALFRRVLDREGATAGELLHIGDHDDRDGLAARAAGCRAIILGRDVRRPGEILRLLGEGAAGSPR